VEITNCIFGLLVCANVVAQKSGFEGQKIDSVIVTSSSGSDHFDKKGTSTTQSHKYTIRYDNGTNQYLVRSYKIFFDKWTSEPKTSQSKQSELKKYRNWPTRKTLIDSLTLALSVSIPPNFFNIGLSLSEFLFLTDETHIRALAKSYRQLWKLTDLKEEEKKLIYSGCQNTDTFNLFLHTTFDTTGYAVVSDHGHDFRVIFYTPANKYSFEGKYPNAYLQPSYTSKTDQSFPIPLLNLNINSILVALLPSIFYLTNTLQFHSLTYPYIKWYLQRKGILYESD
jgi:hypothetical protein